MRRELSAPRGPRVMARLVGRLFHEPINEQVEEGLLVGHVPIDRSRARTELRTKAPQRQSLEAVPIEQDHACLDDSRDVQRALAHALTVRPPRQVAALGLEPHPNLLYRKYARHRTNHLTWSRVMFWSWRSRPRESTSCATIS